MFDAKLVEFELTLSDPVHEFDAGDGRRGSSKMLEAEHRTKPQLDRSMVLFNQIGGHEIEVLAAELRGLLCLVRLLPIVALRTCRSGVLNAWAGCRDR